MYDSLIARVSAFALAGLMSLSMLVGIDALATAEPFNAAQPVMLAASAALPQEL